MKEIRTVLWCLGNPLRGDDGAAVRCGEMLVERKVRHLEVVLCETVPENFAAPLRRTPPERLIIADACLMGLAPGALRLLGLDCLDGLTETTHGMPLGNLIREILPRERVYVIGIEPGSTDFSLSLSPEVKTAVIQLAAALVDGTWPALPRLENS